MRRIYLRIVPLLFAMMFFNYLNRINLGYASLQMNSDLKLAPSVFGFAASIFFLGYMLFELPSNVMMDRFGARRWLSRILLTWGAVSAATCLVWDAQSFYVARFLLGVAEAGFMPGAALYVSRWFPEQHRARAVAGYIIGGALAAVLGGPISTSIMTFCDGILALEGWQWMFLSEGIPTMLLGILAAAVLADSPQQARWLSVSQRAWLIGELARQAGDPAPSGQSAIRRTLCDGRVWATGIMFAAALVAVYGLLIWLPQIVQSIGEDLSALQIGALSALPPLLGIPATLLVSWSSDRTGDRKRHLAALYSTGALALIACSVTDSPVISYGMLSVAGVALSATNPLVWAIINSLASARAGAIAIGLAATLAQTGGLIGPWLIGVLRESSGGFSLPMLAVSVSLLLASAIALALTRVEPQPHIRDVAAALQR
jgi:MFS family permease